MLQSLQPCGLHARAMTCTSGPRVISSVAGSACTGKTRTVRCVSFCPGRRAACFLLHLFGSSLPIFPSWQCVLFAERRRCSVLPRCIKHALRNSPAKHLLHLSATLLRVLCFLTLEDASERRRSAPATRQLIKKYRSSDQAIAALDSRILCPAGHTKTQSACSSFWYHFQTHAL